MHDFFIINEGNGISTILFLRPALGEKEKKRERERENKLKLESLVFQEL